MSGTIEQHVLGGRRGFLGRGAGGLGLAALGGLLGGECVAEQGVVGGAFPYVAPRAKRVIFLFQSGAPSQLDLFDYKPGLRDLRGAELPDSVRQG